MSLDHLLKVIPITVISTRLIGLAALSGAISSEALYNDTTQFREQISIILRPLILNIYQTPLAILDEQ